VLPATKQDNPASAPLLEKAQLEAHPSPHAHRIRGTTSHQCGRAFAAPGALFHASFCCIAASKRKRPVCPEAEGSTYIHI
jgi:hypothetical protein